MDEAKLAALMTIIEKNIRKMCDPQHPVSRITINRDGYGLDENRQPVVVAFEVKLEHLSAMAHLPVAGRTGLVSASGEALRTASPSGPVDLGATIISDEPRA